MVIKLVTLNVAQFWSNQFNHDVVIFFLINKFIYLLLVALGLRCCAQAFSSCGKQGLPFVAARGLLIVVASLVVEHRLWAHRLQ